MVKLSRLLHQSSVYLAGDFLRRALSVIMLPFYTRFLSPADYGTIELLDLLVLVANVALGGMAIGDAMVRIYYEHEKGEEAPVVSTALWCMAAISVVLSAAGVLFSGPLSNLLFHHAGYERLIRLAFVAMFCGNLVEVALLYQRLRQRPVFFILFSGGMVIVTAALNVYCIAFAGWGVWGFFWSKLVCSGVAAALLLWMVLREVRWSFRRDIAAKIIHFSAPLILSGFSVFLIHFSDRFFLSRYTTLAQIGIYAVAYKFGFLISNLVGTPFENAWNVSLYGYTSSSGWQREFARVVRYLLFFLMLAGLSLSIMSDEALTLVAPASYIFAARLVPIVVLAYIVREMGDFFRGVLFVNKRVHIFSGLTCACGLLNLALNQALIPPYGIRGAAWATLFTWFAYMVACWVCVHREHRFPFPVRSFAQVLGIAAVLYAAGLWVNRLPAWWQWGPDALIVAAFVALVWMSGYFPEDDRQTMRSYLTVRSVGRLVGAGIR